MLNNIKYLVFSTALTSAILFSCTATKNNSHSYKPIDREGKIWSALFHQKAAEYDALCYQAFNIAKLRINEAVQMPHVKPLAIITDIDETILDNSPYAVKSAINGKDYEEKTWMQWTELGIAKPIAGSLDFFNYAHKMGVKVFYVTNRNENERAGTLKNLKLVGFPLDKETDLILRTTASSKESRRLDIANNYEIVMLLGDNLSDFSNLWDKKTTVERSQNVEKTKTEFGKKFIIIPNISYGGWEDAIYGNKHNLLPTQKDSAVLSNLQSY